jgi:ferrous iron transport protein A
MDKKIIPLSSLPPQTKASIVDLQGGHHFQRKLHTMGIRKGQSITIVSKQPFHGPLTVKVCGCQMTLGRGMAHKILVEENA